MVTAADWHTRAACGGVDPELFFPVGYGKENTRRPLEICAACPVKAECLADALVEWQEFGVIGGTTPAQRRKIALTGGTHSKRTARPEPAHGTAAMVTRHRRAKQPLCDACAVSDRAKSARYKARRRELRTQAVMAS